MHSKLTNYPNPKSVLVKVDYQGNIGIATHVTYTVIDKNIFKSYCTTYITSKQFKPKLVIYFHQTDTYLEVYYIHTSAFENLELKSYGKQHVHDGPGAKSKLLQHEYIKPHYIYQSSSFQVTLYIFIPLVLNTTIRTVKWTLRHMVNGFQHIIIGRKLSNNLVFPSDKCKRLCIVKIHSTPQTEVNITIKKLSQYGEENTVMCSYAGFVLHELVNSLYSKVYTTCVRPNYLRPNEKNNISSEQMRPIVSKTPAAQLVIYSYPEYTSLYVELFISVSKCKLLRINGCKHQSWLVQEYSEVLSLNKFQDYLVSVPKSEDCVYIQVTHSRINPACSSHIVMTSCTNTPVSSIAGPTMTSLKHVGFIGPGTVYCKGTEDPIYGDDLFALSIRPKSMSEKGKIVNFKVSGYFRGKAIKSLPV